MPLGSYTSAAFTTATGVAVAANADIEVRRESDSALASIFSDRAGTLPITQPGFQADAEGRFTFYAAGISGGYQVKSTKGAETFTARFQATGTARELDADPFWATVWASATAAAARLALGFAAIAAKGDSWWGSAADTIVKLAVGANGTVQVADSAEAAGVRWAALALQPGGRLTLTSGVPVTSADVTGATTVYFSPYKHNILQLYDGAGWVPKTFAEVSQTTADATKSPAAVAPESCYDVFLWNDAGTLRATRGPAWTKAATVTMTIASPCVVTWNAHGLVDGSPIVFTTTGALPTGIVAGTTYYVRSPTVNTFNVSATEHGTNINTSGTQSGVHTGTNQDSERGTGAGTTELELFEGRYVNKNTITNGPAARRGLYVGTIRSDASSQVNDSAAKRHIWNMYNRVMRRMIVLEATASWTYSSSTPRQTRATPSNQLDFVLGLAEDAVWAQADSGFSGSNADAGTSQNTIGLDSITAKATDATLGQGRTSNTNSSQAVATYSGLPTVGRHYLAWLEIGVASTTTFQGSNNFGIQGKLMA